MLGSKTWMSNTSAVFHHSSSSIYCIFYAMNQIPMGDYATLKSHINTVSVLSLNAHTLHTKKIYADCMSKCISLCKSFGIWKVFSLLGVILEKCRHPLWNHLSLISMNEDRVWICKVSLFCFQYQFKESLHIWDRERFCIHDKCKGQEKGIGR